MLDAEMKMKLLISDRPWEHEPDHEEWIDATTGYRCWVWRHPTYGNLNGYVAIPKGHKMWGKGDDVLDVEVHGGLTYAQLDEETDEWVVGFDTNHVMDFTPKLALTLMKYVDRNTDDLEFRMKGTTYRTFEWVKAEVQRLAQQLAILNLNEGEKK